MQNLEVEEYQLIISIHFPYYERQISKYLYFPSCKIWKWANINVSKSHIRKNLECVIIIKVKYKKFSILGRAKSRNW